MLTRCVEIPPLFGKSTLLSKLSQFHNIQTDPLSSVCNAHCSTAEYFWLSRVPSETVNLVCLDQTQQKSFQILLEEKQACKPRSYPSPTLTDSQYSVQWCRNQSNLEYTTYKRSKKDIVLKFSSWCPVPDGNRRDKSGVAMVSWKLYYNPPRCSLF